MSPPLEALPASDAEPSGRAGGSLAAAAPQTPPRQFVSFHMGAEIYAVPLTDVQEIIRLPTVVDVPMAPPSLEGLANLRGSVLPIINLRRLFRMEDATHDDATRVVVISHGSPAGFVVDRMASVVTAEPREIESIDGLRATVDTELLEGIIKRAQTMILILDTSKVAVETGSRASREVSLEGTKGGPAGERHPAGVSDEAQLVSFELDGQEYALPIESVQEIVQVPEAITAVPNVNGDVLGVINLRNRLLPLISLRSLFGMRAAAVGEQSRIVVVTREVEGMEHSVGLVTDTVKEVLRVQRSLIDPLPALLSSGTGPREVDQVCRLSGGKRLVSILMPERLFTSTTVRSALEGSMALNSEGEPHVMADPHPDSADDEEQFVIFRVADEEYGVPIEAVQEIVRIPDQLTRVPKAPSFIEGVVNLRGEVLPVVDQRRRFALPRTEHNDRQRIMVFMVHGVRTGFIVDAVSEVLKIARSQIAVAPGAATQEDSAISRVANIVELGRMILMLDVDRLLSRRETGTLRKVH